MKRKLWLCMGGCMGLAVATAMAVGVFTADDSEKRTWILCLPSVEFHVSTTDLRLSLRKARELTTIKNRWRIQVVLIFETISKEV